MMFQHFYTIWPKSNLVKTYYKKRDFVLRDFNKIFYWGDLYFIFYFAQIIKEWILFWSIGAENYLNKIDG